MYNSNNRPKDKSTNPIHDPLPTQHVIVTLSNSMGVSEADVKCFAQGIANDLVKDGVSGVYLEGDAQLQHSMIEAYASHQAKKIRDFNTIFMTNSHAKQTFLNIVYDMFNQDEEV